MPARKPIQIGERFTRLVVIGPAEPKVVNDVNRGRIVNRFRVQCRCDCGKEVVVAEHCLRFGETKSCGCFSADASRLRFTKHGHALARRTRAYNTWADMRNRCTCQQSDTYQHYGARGITVCERWDRFENFLADMGEPPPGHSIERIDNNKGYSKDNCKWATHLEQMRNTRRAKKLTALGVTGCLSELCEHFDMPYQVVRSRLKLGWPIAEALITRPGPRAKSNVYSGSH